MGSKAKFYGVNLSKFGVWWNHEAQKVSGVLYRISTSGIFIAKRVQAKIFLYTENQPYAMGLRLHPQYVFYDPRTRYVLGTSTYSFVAVKFAVLCTVRFCFQNQISMSGQVGIALFGLGRAGSIHFQNVLANYRVNLRYVVEKDTEKAQALLDKYGLASRVEVVSSDNAEKVYNDPRQVDGKSW